MARTCPVIFTVEAHTQPGEHVLLVGSAPEMGEWNAARGVPLMTSDKDFPTWSTPPIRLSGDGQLSYKYVISRYGKLSTPEWESGPDRKIERSSLPTDPTEAALIEDIAFCTGYNADTDTVCKEVRRKPCAQVKTAKNSNAYFTQSETRQTMATLRAQVRALGKQNQGMKAALAEQGITADEVPAFFRRYKDASKSRCRGKGAALLALLVFLPLMSFVAKGIGFPGNNGSIFPTSSASVSKSCPTRRIWDF
eukprot:TRINITY_DN1034_c0_g1_i1.p1 TRINITY_DN1034_c0_g1~~TRINITY_DN1034_c0_g1_i1.p1  ORF type:complete len:251 (-),score=50.34 TRINITY_DN1034_c0_g1_i1:422-1174(-)